MPIDVLSVKLKVKGKSGKKFKFLVVKKGIPVYDGFPKHLLGDTVEEAEIFFKKFSKTVNDLARSYATKTGLERSDLFGEAILGLAKARRDFDPKRGDFKTYAIFHMKNSIQKYIRTAAMPVIVPAYIVKVNRWINELESLIPHLNKDEKEEVLYGKMYMLLADDRLQERFERLNQMLADETKRLGLSRQNLIERARVLPCTPCGNYLIEKEDDQEQRILAKIVLDKLKNHMTETELTITNMLMEGKTYEEIGNSFSRSRAWVCLQLKEMRNRLRNKFKE